MDLPQELIDEIIDHIPQHDWKSLLNCSLLAKSWVYPSRRRIFRAVDVFEARRLKLWLAKIPPTKLEILQHVRSLYYKIPQPPDSFHPSSNPLHDYLPSLCQLERLTLFSGFLPSPTQIEGYTAFQHTISYLSLQCCTATTNGLVTLVNYFPNLTHLDLFDLGHLVDVQPIPPFSRPLEKLSVTEFYDDGGLDLLDQLMALYPQCEEVAVRMNWFPCPSLAQRVVDGVWASVKRLNLGSCLEDLGNPLTLSNCRELRELEIYALRPGTVVLDLISSITSTNIRRITFTQPYTFEGQMAPHDHNWTKLDNSLCQLIDRLECGVRLEVVFQTLSAQAWWSGELGFKKYLPRFYEKDKAGVGRGN